MVHIRTLLDKMNEIDEGRMKDIFTANQEGKSAKEIAKALKLPLSTVKSILGEGKEEIKEFTDSQLDVLARQYAGLKGKSISVDQANKLRQIFNRIPDRSLDALRRKKIPFLSGLALSRMVQKGMPVKSESLEEARWQIEGQLSYRGIGSYDGFHMVINANSEQDAENKAYKELDKARDRKKIGPGGGGSVEDVEIENIERTSDRLQAPSTYRVSEFNPAEVTEKKSAFRLSYSDRFGKHAGFEDAETLADLQNKAANLRKKGFKIDKMGRNTSPIKEKFAVQVTKKDGGKFIHGTYKSKEEAEKFVKWYKTGDLRTTKKIEVVKEEDEPQSNDQVKSLKVKLDKEKDTDALEKQLTAAQGQINILKQKLENEKNKVVKPEPNRETGEVPLTIGVAHKYLKDKQEKEMKKEEVDNYPTSDINKKKHAAYKDPKSGERKPVYTHEGAKLVYETIKGLKNKAEKSGMPYSILKKVYDRGMAAWRGGHRPGTSQQQWAFARVNSFVTKSSGTWGGADKDLAKQVRGSKK